MAITTGKLWDLLCSRCGEWEKAPGQRWCKFCKASLMREHRAVYADLSPEAKKKANVRSKTKVYQTRGVLANGLCDCGLEAENHHPDYDRFKEVKRVCRKHHLAIENRGIPWPQPRSKAQIIDEMNSSDSMEGAGQSLTCHPATST